jgi:uncharacterized protein (TIGR03437 family)
MPFSATSAAGRRSGTVTLGGVNAEILYAGDPAEFTGQDQINLRTRVSGLRWLL